MNERTIQSTIDFEPDLHEALKSKAENVNSSISELVNSAIRLLLLEDREDIAAFEERADEGTVSHEEFLNQLKADGKL